MILIKVKKLFSKFKIFISFFSKGYKWSMSRLRQYLTAKHGHEIVCLEFSNQLINKFLFISG